MSKPTDEASAKRKARAKRYYDSHREQILQKTREYKTDNKGQVKSRNQVWYELNKEYVKYRTIKDKYGLEPAEYDELISKGCEVCGTHEGKLCVDHNHATGKIRGCLCDACNKALGLLQDSLENTRKLVKYMEVHDEQA
jgi:hypothetical protein